MTTYLTTMSIPKNPAERRVWICFQLRRRGTSQRRLAEQAGVSQQAISEALVRPSSHLERAIAEALGLSPEELFPERYDSETGHRLHWTRGQHRSAGNASRNVEHRSPA